MLVASLLGNIVGKQADLELENPLKKVDDILAAVPRDSYITAVVNLHGDFSSEKLVFGHYLDGRVGVVVGDHWHVPTADAQVLPKGTAHITDVGMCGSLDSSLGVTFESIIPRWRDGYQTRNEFETSGRMQFCALLVELDEATGRATSARHLNHFDILASYNRLPVVIAPSSLKESPSMFANSAKKILPSLICALVIAAPLTGCDDAKSSKGATQVAAKVNSANLFAIDRVRT